MRTTGLQGHASALPCAGHGEALCLSREQENERGRDERVGVNELRGKMVSSG